MTATPTPAEPPRGAPTGGTAEDFGTALRNLLAAAGGPTLTATAAAANAAGADRVSVQKLSNWCSGRHLPDQFDTIAPVLLWLTVRARDHASADQEASAGAQDRASVRTIRDWYRLFTSARHSSTTNAAPLDLQARIEAAEYLLAHADPDTAPMTTATGAVQAAASVEGEELATAILQLTGIDPATGSLVATDVPTSALPADAADLLSAAGLTIRSSSASDGEAGLMRWVAPTIPALWERAVPLIGQYRPALAARTALLADAARWNTTSDPQNLYTWQQLTVCGRHLHTLPTGILATPEQARPYRFGDGATSEHIPDPALPFWDASHAAAERQLTVHRLIMATVIGLIVLAVIAGGVAGILTS